MGALLGVIYADPSPNVLPKAMLTGIIVEWSANRKQSRSPASGWSNDPAVFRREVRAVQKRAPEELTVISCRWDGKQLEAESSGLFAQAHLSSLLCLFITTVEDGF
jgi:hypothetical protein